MPDVYTESMVRNATESKRLDEQLELLNKVSRNIAYLLHPTITKSLPSAPVIADIGTGTGLFLRKLATTHPTATLLGFDISCALFPSPADLPPNVELGIMDIKAPPLSSELGRYDVIHVRLLVAAMGAEDWAPAVDHLHRMLKPGGVLQWEELDLVGLRHYRGRKDSLVDTISALGARMHVAMKEKFTHGWSELPEIMRSKGFLGVERDVVSSDRVAETRQALTANGVVALFAWARMMVGRAVPGGYTMEELEKVEEQCRRDVASGCYWRCDVHGALGFKAD